MGKRARGAMLLAVCVSVAACGPGTTVKVTAAGFAAATRFEENDPAVTAAPAGAWVIRGPEVASFSGGSAGSSDVAGATVTLAFAGNAVTWIGLKCGVCGIATVAIDGGAPVSIDTAGPAAVGTPGLTSAPVYTSPGLASGFHTLVITVTGTTSSNGAQIIVDAFDVSGSAAAASSATRVEDTDPAVTYVGTWTRGTSSQATAGTFAESRLAGDTATLAFNGTGVRWIGFRYGGGGIARVSVDGAQRSVVDTYAPEAEFQAPVFTAAGLVPGPHTLEIEVTGTKNASSVDTWVVVDAFDVIP